MKKRENLSEELGEKIMATYKELYTRIAETMTTDTEVVEFCQKQIAALDRKSSSKTTNPATVKRAEIVWNYISGINLLEPTLGKDITSMLKEANITDEDGTFMSGQKVAAALRYLAKEGSVNISQEVVEEGKKPRCTYCVA